MASVTNKEIPEEFAFFGELFGYRKKFYYPEKDPEYWQSVIDDGNALLQKYHGHEQYEFFKSLVFACINAWEKQIRRS